MEQKRCLTQLDATSVEGINDYLGLLANRRINLGIPGFFSENPEIPGLAKRSGIDISIDHIVQNRDAGAGAARPPQLWIRVGVAPPPTFARVNPKHWRPRQCESEPYKVFHKGCYKVNKNFAEKSWCI